MASTGDFLSYFGRADTDNYYSISESGKNQVLISREIERVADREIRVEDELVSAATHLGVRIFKPTEERQAELDLRWVHWLPSSVAMYLMVSAVAGLIVFGASRDFLRKFWPARRRSFYRYGIYFLAMKIVRAGFLVLFVLPLLGLPILICCVVMTVYYICCAILIFIYRVIRKISVSYTHLTLPTIYSV